MQTSVRLQLLSEHTSKFCSNETPSIKLKHHKNYVIKMLKPRQLRLILVGLNHRSFVASSLLKKQFISSEHQNLSTIIHVF